MKRKSFIRTFVTGLCCTAVLSGQFAQAAGPLRVATSQVGDVALTATGELHGQVLDSQGVPQGQVKVAVGQTNRPPRFVSTDARGQFTVQGLTAGVYQVQTERGSGVYRVWAPRTAPPSAQAGVLVIDNNQVVRGYGGAGGVQFLANPWVMGLVVAGAIAIPLALDSGS